MLSHTSDVHPWFVESLTGGKDGPKANWYVWADPQDDGTAPNNWLSVFGGPAWAYQPARRQHYHHKFLRQQPKLNWRDPDAREAALSVLDFWLEKGVDGFRLDVAGTFLHDADLTPNPAVPMEAAPGPELVARRQPAAAPLRFQPAGERRDAGCHPSHGSTPTATGSSSANSPRRRTAAGPICRRTTGLHSGYTFVMLLARKLEPGFVTGHYATLADYPDHWPTISFSNHDVPRTVSRFGGKAASPELAKMLFALLIALKGTTLVYQGEELGLPAGLPCPATCCAIRWAISTGPTTAAATAAARRCRGRPGPQMGFTTGTPWLPLAGEHRGLSVEEQESDPESALAFSRAMIAFRNASDALKLGDIDFVAMAEPVLGFVRTHGDARILCLFNFSAEPQFVEHPVLEAASLEPVRAGDADLRGASIGLAPHAAVFLRLP